MQEILKNLRNANWWFSAFVIAIIASIVAGFAKDYLERRFDIYVAFTKKRKTEKIERARLYRNALATDSQLLLFTASDAIVNLIMFCALGTFLLIHVVYIHLKYGTYEVYYATKVQNFYVFLFWAIGGAALAFALTYRLSFSVGVIQEAWEDHCKSKGLPPPPGI